MEWLTTHSSYFVVTIPPLENVYFRGVNLTFVQLNVYYISAGVISFISHDAKYFQVFVTFTWIIIHNDEPRVAKNQ